ncbi:hypothetical protein HAX54_038159 [Datura stramonium]|uniref:Uncharacterized protein n=1 Tax=Datura stramonium TaxID=4076 RepID=A0ABS8VNE1_DATST|nr:hypothetical protein [Datura stramonium]
MLLKPNISPSKNLTTGEDSRASSFVDLHHQKHHFRTPRIFYYLNGGTEAEMEDDSQRFPLIFLLSTILTMAASCTSLVFYLARWRFLACHPRLWLRVDRSVKDLSQPGVYPNIEMASAARPGTDYCRRQPSCQIFRLKSHFACSNSEVVGIANVKYQDTVCLLGLFSMTSSAAKRRPPNTKERWRREDGGELAGKRGGDRRLDPPIEIGAGESPDDTTLICSRSSDSALEFMSTCKLANLTVRTELSCCFIEAGSSQLMGAFFSVGSNPLDHLSYNYQLPLGCCWVVPSALKTCSNGVSVLRTRIEGGAKAVLTSGTLSVFYT